MMKISKWFASMITLVVFSFIKESTEERYTNARNREYKTQGGSVRERCMICNFHSLERAPVCATNGNTYSSACFLRVSACMKADPTLQFKHRGKCRSSYRWRNEESEEDDDSSELRTMHTSDSSQFDRASQDNDRGDTKDDVDNPDEEIFHSFLTTKSPFDKDMNDPGTICPQECPMTSLRKVCGSDGLTYASACFLELAACQPNGNANLRIAYDGHCKSRVVPTSLSEGITDESGLGNAIVAKVSDIECCPLQLYEPVCARINGQEITFRSKCTIECYYKRDSLFTEVIKRGNCDDRFALQGLQTYPLTCGNIIEYDVNDPRSYATYISQLMQLYDDYNPLRQKGAYKKCAEDPTPRKQFGRLCKFKQRQFGSWCSPANAFGYGSGQPCIMIQLTKVSNWVPTNYKKPPKKIARFHRQNYITVTCDEIVDKKRIVNATKILPKNGFGFHHFPYVETEQWPYQRQYLSPAVLVRIVPKKLNVDFRIRCRAWAKNIDYNTGIYASMYQAEAVIAFSIKNDILNYKMSRL